MITHKHIYVHIHIGELVRKLMYVGIQTHMYIHSRCARFPFPPGIRADLSRQFALVQGHSRNKGGLGARGQS